MSDSIGSRDDLRVEASRCLPIRFNESSCRRCSDICPHKAISLEGCLSVDEALCTGCLLCTSVCPSGALEMNHDFDASLVKLANVTDPVLGCNRTANFANAVVPCLGGLSSEHLLALHRVLPGATTTLNLSRCEECPNCAMLPILKERLQFIADAGMDRGGCRIVPVYSVDKIHVHHVPIGRRSFFRSLRNSLFRSAASAIAGSTDQIEQRSDYAGKRVPLRRVLLNRTNNCLTVELQALVHSHFDSCVSFGSACTACQGCAAICPTGALLTENPEIHPFFLFEHCTGCSLCEEFCPDGSLSVVK